MSREARPGRRSPLGFDDAEVVEDLAVEERDQAPERLDGPPPVQGGPARPGAKPGLLNLSQNAGLALCTGPQCEPSQVPRIDALDHVIFASPCLGRLSLESKVKKSATA